MKQRLKDEYFKTDKDQTEDTTFNELVNIIKNDVDAVAAIIDHIETKDSNESYDRAMKVLRDI
jgi:hypothetical protein